MHGASRKQSCVDVDGSSAPEVVPPPTDTHTYDDLFDQSMATAMVIDRSHGWYRPPVVSCEVALEQCRAQITTTTTEIAPDNGCCCCYRDAVGAATAIA
jgi:hypothetical protein